MWGGTIWWTHHNFLRLYVDINMQVASMIRPFFDGVSIWRALEKSCTFVSRYFWCTIWRTPLTAFPTTCQKWRRIIISICILFSPSSNLTRHWQHCEEDRKTEKELAGGTVFEQRTKVLRVHQATTVYVSNAKTKSRRLVECQIMWKKKLFLLHDLQCRLTLIF